MTTIATTETARRRLGFFTRLLEEASAVERYRFALEQIQTAERAGFDVAWVAQHHFHEDEGGLPSPLVFLARAAALTRRIRLGTAIVTLPLEEPLRVAEDAAVLDLLSDGRFELGLGSGGTATSFPPFGHDPADRAAIYIRHTKRVVEALRGDTLTTDDGALYPAAPHLLDTLWQATFSADGARHIGAAGAGLMLSRTQPRAPGQVTLVDVQRPIVDAYLANLPAGVRPRILASRSLVVVDDEATGRRLLRRGVDRALPMAKAFGVEIPPDAGPEDIARLLDIHVGTPERVVEELSEDSILVDSTDLTFQVHPVDPGHETTLRSLELIANEVAPALGWRPDTTTTGNAPAHHGGTR